MASPLAEPALHRKSAVRSTRSVGRVPRSGLGGDQNGQRPEFTRRAPIALTSLALFLSGFAAMGMEILWFRLLGVMIKSTSFTFCNTLALYVGGLAVGTFLGIRRVTTSRTPARTFLTLQAGVAVYAGVSVTALVAALTCA